MAVSVLIVDDSRTASAHLAELLRQCGVTRAVECPDNAAALREIERDPSAWDAVFVDLYGEGIDSLQLFHQLDAQQYRGGIVVMPTVDQKVLQFAAQVVNKYSLRILGSLPKPIDASLVGSLVKRIAHYSRQPVLPGAEGLKRRDVQQALEQKRLVPYFQPVVSLHENRLLALECLVRLDILGRGTILPSAFIQVADQFDLLNSMTLNLLEAVLPQYHFFRDKTGCDCDLSINLAPSQLTQDDLADWLAECCARWQTPCERVVLEITENEPICSVQQHKNLLRLRDRGFGLALDDYGAGFTNLRQMHIVPFTEIKLDRQMVDGVSRDQVLGFIAQSVCALAQELDVCLVAEGVEHPQDLACLQSMGVENFQGYLFSRPKPLAELIRWHNAWHRVTLGAQGGLGVEFADRLDGTS